MKAIGKAFLLGGSLSAFFFVAVKFGVDLGFRAAGAVQRRRVARERTET